MTQYSSTGGTATSRPGETAAELQRRWTWSLGTDTVLGRDVRGGSLWRRSLQVWSARDAKDSRPLVQLTLTMRWRKIVKLNSA